MKIKKSTPRDLLNEHRFDKNGNELFKPCKDEQKAEFYVLSEARCIDCDHVEKVRIGFDEHFYHECNRGNVVTYVPRTWK